MIEARRVSYALGQPLLDDVTVQIAAAECVGLTGDPAAGAALLQIMSGVLKPDAGAVHLRGLAEPAGPRDLHSATAFVLVDLTSSAGLRVDEYLRFISRIRCAPQSHLGAALSFAERVGVRRDAAMVNLNPHHHLIVALLAAMTSAADVILVDHPLDTLDEPARSAAKACVTMMRGAGRSVVVRAEDADILGTYVDRMIRFDAGRAADAGGPLVEADQC
jgi:ABC-type multidrug transport system ATPase subunit